MKNPSRLMFVGLNRFSDLFKVLDYDANLSPNFDHTYIFCGPNELTFDLHKVLVNLGYNGNNFTVFNDTVLFNHFKLYDLNIDFYKFGGWITQQFIKLLALDYINEDRMLIQDCDTFAINNYTYFDDSSPVLFYIPNRKQSPEYYKYLKDFTNLEPFDNHCYVTEFMPVTSKLWSSLKNKIESIHGKYWLLAMYDQFSQDFIGNQIWFSEYELLANWMLHQDNSIKTLEQSIIRINDSRHNFNCVGF